ncbi:MAG: SDR family NAD(P)-dependent oxidoreductase [Acidimicrobiia bacterium]
MSALQGKTVLITGANAGLGKEVARQLALRPEIARIYLACRNKERATQAKAELEAATDRHIFDIILMDVADLGSVRAWPCGHRRIRRRAGHERWCYWPAVDGLDC